MHHREAAEHGHLPQLPDLFCTEGSLGNQKRPHAGRLHQSEVVVGALCTDATQRGLGERQQPRHLQPHLSVNPTAGGHDALVAQPAQVQLVRLLCVQVVLRKRERSRGGGRPAVDEGDLDEIVVSLCASQETAAFADDGVHAFEVIDVAAKVFETRG